MMTEIRIASPSCVVAVCMCDDGPVHRLPGINIKIALCTEQTFICKIYQRHVFFYNLNNKKQARKLWTEIILIYFLNGGTGDYNI
jgi:hypothetical protein